MKLSPEKKREATKGTKAIQIAVCQTEDETSLHQTLFVLTEDGTVWERRHAGVGDEGEDL